MQSATASFIYYVQMPIALLTKRKQNAILYIPTVGIYSEEVFYIHKKLPKEKRFDDILDAAVEIFVEKGFENASMDEIASKSGMSKGGLYHHFSNKDAILLAATIKMTQPCNLLIDEIKLSPSVVEGLKIYMKNYLEYWLSREKEFKFFAIALIKALGSADIKGAFQSYFNEYISMVETVFQRGIDRGEFIPFDTKHNAALLLSALDGILIYMTISQDLQYDSLLDLLYEKHINIFILH